MHIGLNCSLALIAPHHQRELVTPSSPLVTIFTSSAGPTANITITTHGNTIRIPRLGPSFLALAIYPFLEKDTRLPWSTMSCMSLAAGVWMARISKISLPSRSQVSQARVWSLIICLPLVDQRWYMFQNMGPAPTGRSGHAMASWQNKVFVLGGESYTAKKTDDTHLVHILDTGQSRRISQR